MPDDAVKLKPPLSDAGSIAPDMPNAGSTGAEPLQSAEELRSLAYCVSHDMKSPSNTVRLIFSEILETEGDRITVEGRELVQMGMATVDRMRSLIEDTLRFASVSNTTRPAVRVDLDRLLRDCLDDHYAEISRKRAVIEHDKLPVIAGQESPLRMLLSNLVGNALKYVAADVRPRIAIRDLSGEGEPMVRICVADNGIGIAPEYHARIFGMFERLHLQQEYEGTGLGLAICQRVAQAHGGKITLHSVPGKGTRFIVTLPRGAAIPASPLG